MGKHGFADTSKTKRYEDDGAFLVLRTGLSKRDEDVIDESSEVLRLATEEGMQLRPQTKGNQIIFELLCSSWSFSEKPTAEEYGKLSAVTGKWVDECLMEAIQEGRGEIEGKDSSPATPSASPGSSQAEDDQPSTD